jgi:hypothetical protein
VSEASGALAVQGVEEQSWTGLVWVGLAVVGAWLLYALSAAPGLTWAHQGADGGELLAAAVTNGVPHPPGYPIYMLLLQGWLAMTGILLPGGDLAWRGNLFSALCAGLSTGFVVLTAAYLLRLQTGRWPCAMLAGLAWAISPLLWSQAIISEVYGLHALIVAFLGWATLVKPQRLWYLGVAVALGVAHHLTTVLLLPAVLYFQWVQTRTWSRMLRVLAWLAVGCLLGALFYVRIPWAAQQVPPVNWGFADNWQGFWWLVSGQAYRGYLFSIAVGAILSRLAAWAYTLTVQYTPVGLALALIGLAHIDREQPSMRNFALLWLTPISIYSIGYYTRDSDIYLLPVVWLLALLATIGLGVSIDWLQHRLPMQRETWRLMVALLFVGIVVLLLVRWPSLALRQDVEAQRYLSDVAAVLEPGSIVISRDDRETFALWYGVWGSGELDRSAPGVIMLNDSLYQFDWYRRLQGSLHPDIPAISDSITQVLAQNAGRRPIFFAEQLPIVDAASLTPVGPLWRYDLK